jgi:two-component system, NtrC family, C4-dicarboxylate transport sensor histidine kinase DctB
MKAITRVASGRLRSFASLRPVTLGLILITVIAVPLAAWGAARWARLQAQGELAELADARLALYGSGLSAELDKYRGLPMALSWDPEVSALLTRRKDAGLIDRVDRKLATLNAGAALSALYVMAPDGTTLAASNWTEANSFIGRNFGFRPYFKDALAGRIGRYFALGTTSQLPGYYISYPVWAPVWAENHTLGVVVAKIAMDALETTWRQASPDHRERVIVTDRHGIILITSTPEWRFHTLAPLSPESAADIRNSQQYEGAAVEPLPVIADRRATDGVLELRGDDAPGGRVRYLVRSATVPNTPWQVHVLLDTAALNDRTTMAALIGGASVLLLLAAGGLVTQRRHALTERLAWQRQAQQVLECRVVERTAELQAANRRLEAEMAERERAEAEARRAQAELIEAGKLAALGQMSAGIVHEVNQPLAAIRSYAENAGLLLEHERFDAVRRNLAEICDLTDRMARITRQLKTFARKAPGTLEPVSANAAIERALSMMEPTAADRTAELVFAAPSSEVTILGESGRLEQAVVNLVANALDAVAETERRTVTITLTPNVDTAVLTVRDTGPGIAEADLTQIFYPFFTTKEVGAGLGLGLSITYGIVQDFGGHIDAANHSDGGALFTVTLRRMETP